MQQGRLFYQAVFCLPTPSKTQPKGVCMKSYNQLARVAFAAYLKRSSDIDEPEAARLRWLAMDAEQQACWIEAVKAVSDEVKHIH
jgi:hypothetical protein